VHVDLDLVLIVFKGSQNGKGVTDRHILGAEPAADFRLALAGGATLVAIVVQPQHARHHTS